MTSTNIKRVCADTVAAYISGHIPGLAGKVKVGAAGPQVNAPCLALMVLPEEFRFFPGQADEVFSEAVDDGKVIVDIGSFSGLFTLQLFTVNPFERETYEQAINDLFLETQWAPGTIFMPTPNLTVKGYASLYSAELKVRLESEEWSEEFAFEAKRMSFLEVEVDCPALTTYDANTIESLQVALSSMDTLVDVEIVEVLEDGTVTQPPS